MIEISAQVVPGKRTRITVRVSGSHENQGTMSLYWMDPLRGWSFVRGAWRVPARSDVFDDTEAPFNREIAYRVRHYTTGEDFVSEPIVLPSARPFLSNPITGVGATVTIVDWPELAHAGRGTLLEIEGRRQRVRVHDVELSATSSPQLLTYGTPELLQFRSTVADGRPLLMRASSLAVEDGEIGINERAEERAAPKRADNWDRLHNLTVSHEPRTDPTIRAIGDTLGDIAGIGLGTLGNMYDRWPTLLDIAAEPKKAVL